LRCLRKQTELLYERRVTTIDAPSLPITHTNYETSEEYGGGVINVAYTLDLLGSQAIDEGLLVISSSLTDLGNGLVVKETHVLPDAAWSELEGTEVDPRTGIVISVKRQVVDAGVLAGSNG
jgi:hypothetical protein